LKTNGDLTDDQLAVVKAMSAEVDASWDTDVAAYLASKKKLTPVPAASSVSSTASEPAAVVVQPVAAGV
jgi:hypothetical protein